MIGLRHFSGALVFASHIALAIGVFAGGAAYAAEPPAQDRTASKVSTGGEVIVNGKRVPACAGAAGGGHGFDLACLNRQLQAAAEAGTPPPPAIDAATRDAQTPSKVGTFSQAATAERLGKNFGHSAQPYRPLPPVTTNPIMTGKPR
ncbi:MAG TPA: hypothetical protein VFF94_10735 [Novosphingobium sp.]|nr:hypothetical protein [Novosphingobium sp.]